MSIITTLRSQTVPGVASIVGLKKMRSSTYGPCPLCGEERRGSSDARGALGIERKNGGRGVHCHRCDENIDVVDLIVLYFMGCRVKELQRDQWKDLEEKCAAHGWHPVDSGAPTTRSQKPRKPVQSLTDTVNALTGNGGSRDPSGPKKRGKLDGSKGKGPFTWMRVDAEREPLTEECREYLHGRGLSDETIEAWGLCTVRAHRDWDKMSIRKGEQWLCIPLKDRNGRVVNYKMRRMESDERPKYMVCPDRPNPLFGSHLLDPPKKGDAEVLILGGELDLITMWQYGRESNLVASTEGEGNWDEEWLDILEPYEQFMVGLDNDKAGDKGADLFAEKMGKYRCSRVRWPENDVNACVMAGVTAEEMERAAEHDEAMTGITFEQAVYWTDDLETLLDNPDVLKGASTGSDKLDKVLGGIRPGLFIAIGDTGAGKTTWTTWLLFEQAIRGHGVAITSFEQRPIGTVQKLLRMKMGGDFSRESKEARAHALKQLSEMPLYIVNHYGQMGFAQLVESIRFARRRYGVKRFLIDHLGFLSVGEKDRVEQMETIVRTLAILAVNEDLTIFAITHPSNAYVSQKRRVQLSDAKGASAIRQDAHDGVVVYRGKPTKKIPFPHAEVFVEKVRSEFGTAGSTVILPFDPLSCTYADRVEDLPNYVSGKVTMVDPLTVDEGTYGG